MSSKLEHLDPDVKLPFDEQILLSGTREQRTDEQRKLVKSLQDLLEKLTTLANFAVDLIDGEAVYYGLKQSDGTYPDGTWRRIQVGNNLEDQVKISGTWTTVQTRERPV